MSRVEAHRIRCESEGCSELATFHLTWAESKRCWLAQHLCEEHAKQVLSCHDFATPLGPGQQFVRDGATGFDIYLVLIAQVYEQQVLYLKEVGGKRFFPILTGLFEASTLDRLLKDTRVPRPLTHDVLASVIRSLDGELFDILIDEFDAGNHAYHAKLRIRRDNRLILVDTRPSDAFAVALIFQAPILVAEDVIKQIATIHWKDNDK